MVTKGYNDGFETYLISDVIELGREINSYAPVRSDGGKMKIGVHADQGDSLIPENAEH